MDLSNTKGDRLLGIVVLLGAAGYAASALTLPVGFMTDPVGSKTFPLIVAGTSGICGLVLLLRPDPDPDFPDPRTWAALAISVAVLVAYAYALKPLGFLLPTTLAAGILSYQIDPKPRFAVLAGLGLAIGLFVLFRFGLGLNLQPLPRGLA